MISIAIDKQMTPYLPVEKGVLQDDPCSPLLFNVCFNPFMKMISQPKYTDLGYYWILLSDSLCAFMVAICRRHCSHFT